MKKIFTIALSFLSSFCVAQKAYKIPLHATVNVVVEGIDKADSTLATVEADSFIVVQYNINIDTTVLGTKRLLNGNFRIPIWQITNVNGYTKEQLVGRCLFVNY